jgi:hypothetical protein
VTSMERDCILLFSAQAAMLIAVHFALKDLWAECDCGGRFLSTLRQDHGSSA